MSEQPSQKIWIFRVDDGANLHKSKYPFWGIKRGKHNSLKSIVQKKMKRGDIICFLTSKEFGGKIIAMAEYTEFYDRLDEPLLSIHTKSNEDQGWVIKDVPIRDNSHKLHNPLTGRYIKNTEKNQKKIKKIENKLKKDCSKIKKDGSKIKKNNGEWDIQIQYRNLYITPEKTNITAIIQCASTILHYDTPRVKEAINRDLHQDYKNFQFYAEPKKFIEL